VSSESHTSQRVCDICREVLVSPDGSLSYCPPWPRRCTTPTIVLRAAAAGSGLENSEFLPGLLYISLVRVALRPASSKQPGVPTRLKACAIFRIRGPHGRELALCFLSRCIRIIVGWGGRGSAVEHPGEPSCQRGFLFHTSCPTPLMWVWLSAIFLAGKWRGFSTGPVPRDPIRPRSTPPASRAGSIFAVSSRRDFLRRER